jgi:uncharacterized membrane protein
LNFLIWNLFLAFLPLLFAWLLYQFAAKMNKVVIILCSLVWLLFYPNAPYMISDLIHVQQLDPLVLYDAMIIFSFAILALFFGFYSLKIIHVLYQQIAGRKTAHTVVWVSIILSSAGIYLGRILRLNSWDLFTHPLQVLATIFEHLFPVGKNPTTYIIIVLYSVIQFILLIMTKDMDMIGKNNLISGDYSKD